MALVGEAESPQRARLLEHHARALMLRGQYADAAAGALEAHAMAERLGVAELESRSLNTLGLSHAALGEVDARPGHAAPLARPRRAERSAGRSSCRP